MLMKVPHVFAFFVSMTIFSTAVIAIPLPQEHHLITQTEVCEAKKAGNCNNYCGKHPSHISIVYCMLNETNRIATMAVQPSSVNPTLRSVGKSEVLHFVVYCVG